MKKLIISLLIFILSISFIFAGSWKNRNLDFSIELGNNGVGFGNVNVDTGLKFRYNIHNNIGMTSGINYSYNKIPLNNLPNNRLDFLIGMKYRLILGNDICIEPTVTLITSFNLDNNFNFLGQGSSLGCNVNYYFNNFILIFTPEFYTLTFQNENYVSLKSNFKINIGFGVSI